MRWDQLFADLAGQFDEAERAELEAEVADRTRRELARVRLADRLRAATSQPMTCHVVGAGRLSGRVEAVGPDWVLLSEGGGREALIPLGVLVGVSGLGTRAATGSLVAVRLWLAAALRGIARDRSPVLLTTVDGTTVAGTIDAVGADFVDLAQHGPGESRRAGDVRGVRTVPNAAVAAVRRSA